jgi:hypothetical protein
MSHIYTTLVAVVLLAVGCTGCGNKAKVPQDVGLSLLEGKKTADNEATTQEPNSRLIIVKAGDIELVEQEGAVPGLMIPSWVYYYIVDNSNELLVITVSRKGTAVTHNKIATPLRDKWVTLDTVKIDTPDLMNAISEHARNLFIYGYGVAFQVEMLADGSAVRMQYGEGNSGPYIIGVKGNVRLGGSRCAPDNFSMFSIETSEFTGPIMWTPFVDKNGMVMIVNGRDGSVVKVEDYILKTLERYWDHIYQCR